MVRIFIIFLSLLVSQYLDAQIVYDKTLKYIVLSKEGNFSEVIELITGDIGNGNTNDPHYYLLRGEAFLSTGSYRQAEDDFLKAEGLQKNSGSLNLARLYALQGKVDPSIDYLKQHLVSDRRKREKDIISDPSFQRIENTPQWRQLWKSDWYPDIEKSLSELEFSLKTGRFDEAESLLKDIRYSYRGTRDELYAKALYEYSTGKIDESARTIAELVANNDQDMEALYLLADIQDDKQNYSGAIQTLTKMISLEVPDPEIFYRRASLYLKTGEFVKATYDIERHLKIIPEDKKGIRLAGKIASASGDNLKALEYFSSNIRLHPGDPECFIDRAGSYFVARSWQYSISDYSMALDLDPLNPASWYNKGIALINSGKSEEGCSDLRRSLRLGEKRAAESINRYCIK